MPNLKSQIRHNDRNKKLKNVILERSEESQGGGNFTLTLILSPQGRGEIKKIYLK